MEDFSNDIRKNKPVSPKMRAMLSKEKAEARKRIVDRGIVHFRADADFMKALLCAAEAQKIAPGTLCRQVVWEYLQSKPSGFAEIAAALADAATSLPAVQNRDIELPTAACSVQEPRTKYHIKNTQIVQGFHSIAVQIDEPRSYSLDEIRGIVQSELRAFAQTLAEKQNSSSSKPRKKNKRAPSA